MALNNPLEHEDNSTPAEREVSSPISTEAVDLDRRKFLFGMGAALAAASLPSREAGGAETNVKKTAATSGRERAEAQKPVIEEVGEGKWVINRSESEPNGEGMRGPSIIPARMILEPITLTATAEIEPNGEAFDQHYLLNLPRDIGDTARLKSNVHVTVTGLKDHKSELTMVASEPHNNQFLSVHVTGTPTGGPIKVVLKELSWMSHPAKPVLEGKDLARGGLNPSIVQNCEAQMAAVHGKLKYNAAENKLDLTQVRGEGDCGTFAQMVKQDTAGKFETVVGYCTGCIGQNGGLHGWNVSTNGNFRFDGAMSRYGAESGEYIATAVGTDFNFESGSVWARYNGPNQSFNNFNILGTGGKKILNKMELSTPGQGVDGATLAGYRPADKKELAELMKLHNEHVAARRRVATDKKTASTK